MGPLRVHFRIPLHIWGRLGGSGAKLRPSLGQIFSFPDPPLPTQSDFYSRKWVVQVSHTYYYLIHGQLASIGAILGPLKSVFGHFGPIRQIYPLFLILEGVANSAMIG